MILYNNIFQTGSTGAAPIKITVAELKALADASQLDTNAIYQITDYEITKFSMSSRGTIKRYFDILVQPYSNNKLYKNAAATRHDGDTIYNEFELRQWQIEYYLGNYTQDYDQVLWADLSMTYGNPNGEILYLKDHNNNEAPFDFKNITFNGVLLFGDYDNVDYSQKNNAMGCSDVHLKAFAIHVSEFLENQYINIFGQVRNVWLDNAIISHNSGMSFQNISNVNITGEITLEIYAENNDFDIQNLQIKNISASTIKIGNQVNPISRIFNIDLTECYELTIIPVDAMIYNNTFKFIQNKTVNVNLDGSSTIIYTTKADTVNLIS